MSESGRVAIGVRILGVLGAVGGLLWLSLPVTAALTFYGVETGFAAFGALSRLGVLFQFAGASVVFMLAGLLGVHLRYRSGYGRSGGLGAGVSALGFVLLLPGSVVPSDWVPAPLAGVVPLVFFAGLFVLALGSLALGLAAYRTDVLPAWLAVAYAVAMPGGAGIGAVAAVSGGGTLAFVLGCMVPYGLAWVVLGSRVSVTTAP